MSQPLNQQSGNSWRYLYERLGEKRFQQLCSALLADQYPGITVFPVGQADGGRDAVHGSGPDRIVYQVKWTSKRQQNPHPWLKNAVEGEKENIERLVREGAVEYILITCVAGTSAHGRGSMDRLDKELAEYSKQYGIRFSCWWQADLDARVDSAPPDLKWAYSEMLAGHDAIHALIHGGAQGEHEQGLHDLLTRVLATQWVEDSKVKFKQTELDTLDLVDLFVDVEAQRTSEPRATQILHSRHLAADAGKLGGAAQYLVGSDRPLTLVRGEPGQGKSTLGQYICQAHRAEYLKGSDYLGGRPPSLKVKNARLPIRADLHEYAQWLSGGDPYDDKEKSRKTKLRRGNRSVEMFLARLMSARSGGLDVTVETVTDVLRRFPMLIVLDGLDEVAQREVRSLIVTEIDEFAARLGTSMVPPRLVVTTRPNASNLPEPSNDRFEVITLTALSPELRILYLRKWATAQSVRGTNRRVLERTFRERSMEPHIAQLANNPMQLTILLYLMHKRGDSIPTGRTELYSSYMETFLDREASKSADVHEHRQDLEEVTSYLGWRFQTMAETQGAQHALPVKTIKSAILNYLFDVDKDVALVEDLFRAATDRVWALSSKVQGTFAFDVQSVSEYFAAKYLYEFAGAARRDFDPANVLRQLVRRSFWREVSRFYAGFARVNDLAAHLDALAEEWEKGLHPTQTRMTAWALIGDGVFSARPRSQRQAAELFTDDYSVRLLSHFAANDVTFNYLPQDRGGSALADHLRRTIEEDPNSPIALERASLAAKHMQDRDAYDSWWQHHLFASRGTSQEESWLKIGTPFTAGNRISPETTQRLLAGARESPQLLIDSGVNPEAGTDGERVLVGYVLDGLCSDAIPGASGYASDLIRILAPQYFLRRAAGREEAYVFTTEHPDRQLADHQRQTAFKRLQTRDSRFSRVQRAMRAGKGQSGTTSVWSDTASEVAGIFGPCWLASEIALIGAAAPEETWRSAATLAPGGQAFGPNMDYGLLQHEVRINRSKTKWWIEQHDENVDDLSRATWVLAALTVAAPNVFEALLGRVVEVVASLPGYSAESLLLSSSRIGSACIARRLPADLLQKTSGMSARATALLLHHCNKPQQDVQILALTDSQLSGVAELGIAGWPAHQAITERLKTKPTPDLWQGLRACGPNAIVDVSGDLSSIEDAEILSIVRASKSYPRDWVVAAGLEQSRRSEEPALGDLGESERWFG